jgi:hypothetical protein
VIPRNLTGIGMANALIGGTGVMGGGYGRPR